MSDRALTLFGGAMVLTVIVAALCIAPICMSEKTYLRWRLPIIVGLAFPLGVGIGLFVGGVAVGGLSKREG